MLLLEFGYGVHCMVWAMDGLAARYGMAWHDMVRCLVLKAFEFFFCILLFTCLAGLFSRLAIHLSTST
jgi:hypothetical protein